MAGSLRTGSEERRTHAPPQWSAGAAATVLFGTTIGYSGLVALPLWVAAVCAEPGVSRAAVGVIGSVQLLAAAIASLTLSAQVARLPLRQTAVAAGLGIFAANLLCVFAAGTVSLAVCRAASGLGEGALLAVLNAAIARRPDAGRVFAVSQLCLGCVSATVFFCVPPLIARFGRTAPFGFVAVLAALGVVLLLLNRFETPPESPAALPAGAGRKRLNAGDWYGLAIFWCLYAGLEGVWTFVVPLGRDVGVGLDRMGAVLAAGAVVAIVGPLIARGGSGRLAAPGLVAVGLVLSALAAALSTFPHNAVLYEVGVFAIQPVTLFNIAVIMAFLAITDRTGRAAAAAPAAINLGSAGAPAVAGYGLMLGGGHVLGIFAGGMHALALLALMLAVRGQMRATRRVHAN